MIFISDNLNSCSEEQLTAIRHIRGPMLVVAGPGSGKTFVITQRIKYLIEMQGISPGEILVITFTKAASMEMKKRFEQICKNLVSPVTFGTFHAIYFNIIKKAKNFSDNSIIKAYEKKEILQEILQEILERREIKETTEKEAVPYIVGGAKAVPDQLTAAYLSEVSKCKNECYCVEDYHCAAFPKEEFCEVFTKYEESKQLLLKVDFDDMVLMCHRLFKENPQILTLWQERYQYILIDEFQDINPMQYEVIKMLAFGHKNLFVVGDDDQSIYGFRGSSPRLMNVFLEEFGAKKTLLSVNYRSVSSVVETAGRSIKNNKDRFAKDIRPKQLETGEVIVKAFSGKKAESDYIIECVMNEEKQGGLDDTAVIVRTNSAAAQIAQKLGIYNIPFVIKDAVENPYEHFIVKDILAYIKIAHGIWERRLFYMIMNRPKRYISRNAVDSNCRSLESAISCGLSYYSDKNYMQENFQKLGRDLEMLSRLPPYGAVKYIENIIGYNNYICDLMKSNEAEHSDLEERLEFIAESAAQFDNMAAWERHINDFGKKLEQSNQKEGSEKTAGVKLMTMHSSKGLEFDTVLLPFLVEGAMPPKRAVLLPDIEEERRLFYVAMTRAKKKLVLSYVDSGLEKKAANAKVLSEYYPSRFVKELGLEKNVIL